MSVPARVDRRRNPNAGRQDSDEVNHSRGEIPCFTGEIHGKVLREAPRSSGYHHCTSTLRAVVADNGSVLTTQPVERRVFLRLSFLFLYVLYINHTSGGAGTAHLRYKM